MNRTLKRPMFRMGGSANTGITSGLDTTKPKRGLVNEPGGYSGKLPYDMGEPLRRTAEQVKDPEILKSYRPYFERPAGEATSRFLTSFGLDLLGRSPTGNIFQTAALSAKGPTEQLYKDIDERRLMKSAAEADLFKTLLQGNIDIAASAAGNEGEASKGVKLQIADDIENTMDLIFKLENKKQEKSNEFTSEDSLLLEKKKLRIEQLTKNDEVRASLLGDSEYTQKILRKIKGNLIDKKNPDGSLMYPGGDEDTKLLEDMQSFYLEFFRTGKFPEFKDYRADGGRAGYQIGGGVMGGGEDMGANRVTETATTPEPKIDFETLRVRLPREISDDIVKLIAASPQAMEDFATIATQQDVDQFNKKYSVNLVLPQEA
jgi:hypothetical protein